MSKNCDKPTVKLAVLGCSDDDDKDQLSELYVMLVRDFDSVLQVSRKKHQYLPSSSFQRLWLYYHAILPLAFMSRENIAVVVESKKL